MEDIFRFDEIPKDLIEDIFLRLIKNSKNNDLDTLLLLNKEYYKLSLDILKRIKWDSILLEKGKVCLERLISICSYPELREKSSRYLQGKSKFIYKNIILQLNHPKYITCLDIMFNNIQIKCTTHLYLHQKFTTGRWGISIYIKDTKNRNVIKNKIPYTDIVNIYRFLGKVKTKLPNEFHKYIQTFSQEIKLIKLDTLNEWIWISKYTDYHPR